jgi:hypothetical protein
MISAASWRYALALMVAGSFSCHLAIRVDAFAPPRSLTSRRATKNRQWEPFLKDQSFFTSPIPSRRPIREFDPILAQKGRTTNEQGSDPQTSIATKSPSTDGVPSSPLDRPVLSAIDAIALFVFAGIGKASHSAVDGSLDVGAVLVTALPFLVSWFLIAPLVGSYTPEATRDVKSAVVQTAKGWALAIPMGCVLRGVIKGYVPPVPFVVVTLISTLIILSMGRAGYTFLSELYVEMF